MVKPERNSPELWDNLWQREYSEAEDRHRIRLAELSVRWQRIQQRIDRDLGSLKGLRVIEVGAGSGIHAALMAAAGCEVTVLDYSPAALERSEELFRRRGLRANMVQADALKLPETLKGNFDISMSFGLTEHFLDQARDQINRSHFELLRPNGMTFISVPHRNNPPYRIFKWVAERAGMWKVGEEYPYNRAEFIEICKRLDIQKYEFFGESLFASAHFLNPLAKTAIRNKLGLGPKRYDASLLKPETGTFLDTSMSYSLILCGTRQPDWDNAAVTPKLARSA